MITKEQLHEMVQLNIDSHGQHLVGVFDPEDGQLPFVYTIGNALKGLPELLIVGRFDARVVASILNHVADDMRAAGERLPEVVDIGGKFPIHARTAGPAAKTDWTIQAGVYLGHQDYEVQQLLLCYPEGVYPGEEGIDPGYEVPLI